MEWNRKGWGNSCGLNLDPTGSGDVRSSRIESWIGLNLDGKLGW